MEAKTIITLARLFCGAGIMVTSMITGENGSYQMFSLILMGIPFEALQKKEAT